MSSRGGIYPPGLLSKNNFGGCMDWVKNHLFLLAIFIGSLAAVPAFAEEQMTNNIPEDEIAGISVQFGNPYYGSGYYYNRPYGSYYYGDPYYYGNQYYYSQPYYYSRPYGNYSWKSGSSWNKWGGGHGGHRGGGHRSGGHRN